MIKMINNNGDVYSVTPNQAAKLFVYQWGANASERWKTEYKNYSSLSESMIDQVDKHIDKHIERVGKFLARKYKGSNEHSKIEETG